VTVGRSSDYASSGVIHELAFVSLHLGRYLFLVAVDVPDSLLANNLQYLIAYSKSAVTTWYDRTRLNHTVSYHICMHK
jgi:hypothetical protein